MGFHTNVTFDLTRARPRTAVARPSCLFLLNRPEKPTSTKYFLLTKLIVIFSLPSGPSLVEPGLDKSEMDNYRDDTIEAVELRYMQDKSVSERDNGDLTRLGKKEVLKVRSLALIFDNFLCF
jgi:hypothetical protein